MVSAIKAVANRHREAGLAVLNCSEMRVVLL